MSVYNGAENLHERQIGYVHAFVAAPAEHGCALLKGGAHLAQETGLSHAGLAANEDNARGPRFDS
jgi:hypothetical protein